MLPVLAYTFLITDENDFLISTLEDDSFDFENAIGGQCRVYGLSFSGSVLLFPGDNIFQVDELASGCFDLTDNYIQLTRSAVNGGIISTVEGDTIVYTCPADGVADIVELFTTGVVSGAQYQYIVTDDQNSILGFIDGNSFNFDVAGFGTCRVYGASFTGDFTASPGADVTTDMISDACFELSSNYVTVVRDQPAGGTVSADGQSEVLVCLGTGDESVTFDNDSSSEAQYAYVVTDTANVILAISTSPTIDFAGAGEGLCRVWGLSYTGNLSAVVGDTASVATLATSCFELSSEFVTVIRSVELDGGMVTNLLGETIVFTCPGDDNSDLVAVETTSTSSADYAFFITDENNIVLAPDIDGNVIDFNPADPGVCRVWGISYTGNLTLAAGQDATEAMLSSECFVLSDNFITVIRDMPDGATVSTSNGDTSVTIVVGDNIPDIISFTNTSTSNSLYNYVITDEENVIIALPAGNTQDFEGSGLGTCRVWGLSYTGEVTAMIGEDADTLLLSDDCFDLSDNFIEVIRVESLQDDEDPELLVEEAATHQALEALTAVNLSPNPAANVLQVQYELEVVKSATSEIQIMSASGAIVAQEQVAAAAGLNTVELDVSALPQGLYIVRLQHGEEYELVKFIKGLF